MSQAMDVCLDHQIVPTWVSCPTFRAGPSGLGRCEGAEESLRSAMSTALALGAVPARIRATTHLAELLEQSGRSRAAFDVLDRMLRTLDKMTGFGGLNRALALRARLTT